MANVDTERGQGMNSDISTRQRFSYKTVEIYKEGEKNSLGIGSYGAVYRAKCDQLPCAAKILHPILFQTNDPAAVRLLQRFEQECEFMSGIRHPNIVQYLGVCRDSEHNLPVLLMELLDESLTKFLEKCSQKLPYHLQVNISHDISLAIAYLHSNRIIHRDLSSNNVLLIAESRAKVTDFGMSTLVHRNTRIQCPGTEVYMPPEALKEPPNYTNKLDCFSLGPLIIQIITRKFPDPGPRYTTVRDTRSPTGTIEIPVPEKERRKNHIDLVEKEHPLLLVAIQCLHYEHHLRPSAQELCHYLEDLKDSDRYTESIVQNGLENSQPDHARMLELETNITDLHQQLQDKNHMIHSLESRLRDAEGQRERSIQEMDRERERHRETLTQKEQENTELRQQVQELLTQVRVTPALSSDVTNSSLNLNWRAGANAPCKMVFGSVTVKGTTAFFRPAGKSLILAYNKVTAEWRDYVDCHYNRCSLIVLDDMLTIVGGSNASSNQDSNKVLSYSEKASKKWEERLPPMTFKRYNPSVAVSGRTLVVAGGRANPATTLSSVEVIDTVVHRMWLLANELPHPLTKASATFCDNTIYLVGSWDQQPKESKSVYACSLSELRREQTQRTGRPRAGWHEVASLPVSCASCATLGGRVVAFGGRTISGVPTNNVYEYRPSSNRWEVIDHMTEARALTLVACFDGNELMVVGGRTESESLSCVEFASLDDTPLTA